MNFRSFTEWKNRIFLMVCILTFGGLSPNVVNAQNKNAESDLTEVLESLTEQYRVYFSYDVQQIISIKTSFQIDQKEAIHEAMERLLSPLNINYDPIGDEFYVLEKKQFINNKNTISALPAQNETIEFQLLDQKDQSYIFNAFVFVRNSSIGTTSDLEGRVQLDIKSLNDVEIVITHLNYETISFMVDDQLKLPKNIFLKSKSVGI